MFIDLNCFLRWAMWPMGLLLNIYPQKNLHRLTKETIFNKITEILGCILEALMKNLLLFILPFFGGVWRNLNIHLNNKISHRCSNIYNVSVINCNILIFCYKNKSSLGFPRFKQAPLFHLWPVHESDNIFARGRE